ncbi:hypothetical protein EDF62_3231 [Leucobacter luti]|uniref:Uncharacterized protein n=1 Tax=Leucobacter luti TaxID=340320 RepID=A0A4R6RRU3_9MICO|nr:hypothetical protein EDF62_3231 [Leucobacter luti]
MSHSDHYPPLRLIAEHGEEVFPPAEPVAKTVLDPSSPAPVPIRPEIKIDLYPDFPDF